MEKYQNRKYKFKVGETVKNILITSQTRYLKERAYNGICQICGDTSVYIERSLLYNNIPCHVCNKKVVKKGFNDLATTDPWMVEYFVNKDESTMYFPNSCKKVLMKCPICGTERMTYIHSLKSRGHIACKCKYKMSEPEYIINNMLEQLDIDSIYQATSLIIPWAKKYRYDFYFTYNDQSYIIETNGMQHYRENNHWRVNFQEQIQRDNEKQLLAEKYVDHYIILDCRYSRISYIKNAVLNSQLPRLLNFSEESIDWGLCVKRKEVSKTNWKASYNKQDKITKYNVLKEQVLEYLNKSEKPNYKEMSKLFHSDYRRLNKIIKELISENKVNNNIIKTRNMNKAEVA